MFIHEAVSTAFAKGLFITRPQWRGRLKIKPTDTDHCCELHCKDRERIGLRWNPDALDLIADDWQIVS